MAAPTNPVYDAIARLLSGQGDSAQPTRPPGQPYGVVRQPQPYQGAYQEPNPAPISDAELNAHVPNTPLARNPNLLDLPSDQLVSAGKTARPDNLNTALQPVENSRQLVMDQGNNAQRQTFNDIMGPGGSSDQEIGTSAIRNILAQKLLTSTNPAMTAELLKQYWGSGQAHTPQPTPGSAVAAGSTPHRQW